MLRTKKDFRSIYADDVVEEKWRNAIPIYEKRYDGNAGPFTYAEFVNFYKDERGDALVQWKAGEIADAGATPAAADETKGHEHPNTDAAAGDAAEEAAPGDEPAPQSVQRRNAPSFADELSKTAAEMEARRKGESEKSQEQKDAEQKAIEEDETTKRAEAEKICTEQNKIYAPHAPANQKDANDCRDKTTQEVLLEDARRRRGNIGTEDDDDDDSGSVDYWGGGGSKKKKTKKKTRKSRKKNKKSKKNKSKKNKSKKKRRRKKKKN